MARYELIYRKRRRWLWIWLALIAFLAGGFAASNHVMTGPPPHLAPHASPYSWALQK